MSFIETFSGLLFVFFPLGIILIVPLLDKKKLRLNNEKGKVDK